ncbi:hypothetical protein PTKIN_Ptkin16aG0088400 [Pterospermum kingtungense]
MVMASSMSLKLACVVILCLVVSANMSQGAITTFGQLTSAVAPCTAYLRGNGAGPVPGNCCTGIKSLNSAALTTADRQAGCSFLKTFAGTVSGINLNLASSLPGKCGVSIPYKISPRIDCQSVK